MTSDNVLITRSFEDGEVWGTYLKEKHHAQVHYLQTIKLSPVALSASEQKLLAQLKDFDCIVFTSSAAPAFFFEALKRYKIPVPWGAEMPRSIMLAGERRKVAAIEGKALLLRTTIASPDLPKFLRARGVTVTELAIYKTEYLKAPDEKISKLILAGAVTHIIFASPSAVLGFALRMRGKAFLVARNIPAIAIGPKVGAALVRAKFKHIRIARRPTIEGMAAVMHRS